MKSFKHILSYKTLLLLVVAMAMESIFAQNLPVRLPPPNRGERQIAGPVGANAIPDYDEPEQQDTTTKPPKIRKPLESFYFSDSLRQMRIFAWKVSMANNDITLFPIDTLLPGFQVDYRFMREDLGMIYLGNVGSATMPINYFRRPTHTVAPFSFLNVWDPFIKRPEGIKFYNSKTPFSRINYESSGSKRFEENMFNFIISHNISPSSTFNFEYNTDGTKGHYIHQRTQDRHINLSFAHTGKRYAIHGGYIYNRGEINENGGVINDADIRDTVISKPREIGVRLSTASNTYLGHTFWFTQSYGIPLRKQTEEELTIQKIPTVYAGMSFERSSFRRIYSDSEKETPDNKNQFYENYYISPEKTRDSITQTMTDLKFFAQLQPYDRDGILGTVTGGVGFQLNDYYMESVPEDVQSDWGTGGKFSRKTTYLYGSAEGAFKKYLRWGASAKYNIAGDHNGDYSIGGFIKASSYIKGKPLTLDASVMLSQQEPDVWVRNYFSNHFAWANSFKKERNTTVSARLLMPSIGMEIGANYRLTQNNIYYDSSSMPAQLSDQVSVTGLYLQKNFRLGKFRLNHRVLMQWSSNQEAVPVPAYAAFLSYAFEFDVVKNVLQMQIGLDGRLTSKYYIPGYNPALSKFYNQREREVGGHPYFDFFVTGKWKRMRIMLKLQHINANMLGNQDYFLALHHPANRMMFKIGISWTFYD